MKILISQNTPSNTAAYDALHEKFGATVEFHPFFRIEPLSSKEFRVQRINLAEFTAIVFSSRHTIDAYFKLCEELRIKVPDTMKYFCSTEIVANYLQKHIVFRKRKIFSGDGSAKSIVSLVGSKHKEEKFLITTTEGSRTDDLRSCFEAAGLDFEVGVLVKPVSQDLSSIDIHSYDIVVLHNPSDLKSLFESYPDFTPGPVRFITYGKSIVKSMEAAGLDIEVSAPNPQAPSVSKAIELYLKKRA